MRDFGESIAERLVRRAREEDRLNKGLPSWRNVVSQETVRTDSLEALLDAQGQSERCERIWDTVIEHLRLAQLTARSICPSEAESGVLQGIFTNSSTAR